LDDLQDCRIQEVGVEGCPINNEDPQTRKGGRPEHGKGATENGPAAEPLLGNDRGGQGHNEGGRMARAICEIMEPRISILDVFTAEMQAARLEKR
jgi:hypothetical protein